METLQTQWIKLEPCVYLLRYRLELSLNLFHPRINFIQYILIPILFHIPFHFICHIFVVIRKKYKEAQWLLE